MRHDITKVPSDSPERCQAISISGQCPNKQIQGSNFCPVHGGNKAEDSEKADSLSNYRLAKYQARLAEKSDSTNLKSLRDEIGILRIVMEEIINRCTSDVDLIMYSGQISDMAIKIQKLVSACHKIDRSLGQLMDKSDVVNIAIEMTAIISKYVDADAIDTINKSFIEIIERISQGDHEN